MPDKPIKRFPYLKEYVDKTLESAAREFVGSIPTVFAVGTALAAVILFASLVTAGAWLAGLLAGLIGCLVLTGGALVVATGIVRKRRLQTDPEARRRQELYRFAGHVHRLFEERKLHRWMDPVALQLLEASAYNWSRLRTALAAPHWNGPDVAAYWTGLRRQAEQAADLAMLDLMLLAQGCVGLPQNDKESEIKGIVEDFVGLDIADALQGLKRMASSDWTAYAHKSPQLVAVLPAAQSIAEKLRDLADEIEEKGSEFAFTGLPAMGARSVESIDVVLGELRAVEQAEVELEDGVHQGTGSF